jgi:hypothetical protein
MTAATDSLTLAIAARLIQDHRAGRLIDPQRLEWAENTVRSHYRAKTESDKGAGAGVQEKQRVGACEA